ncbi:MAG: glycosyltransferase family 4 protein [Desulfobacterales bacterium]
MNKKRKRILLTGPKIGYASGISTHVKNIIESELRNKYYFEHLPVGSGPEKESKKRKIKRISSNYVHFFKRARTFDLIHINTALTGKALARDFFFCFLCEVLKKRYIAQFHSGEDIKKFLSKKTGRNLFIWMIRKSEKSIFLLKSEVNEVKKIFDPSKIYQIYNGINIHHYKRIKKNFLKDEGIILGYIGRVDESKGVFESIAAIHALINQHHLPLKYCIAGYGPAEILLRRMVNDLKLNNFVTFKGTVQDHAKIQFWEELDIFLFPTKFYEGVPYSFLESLASGTPVITTRYGGMNEIVDLVPECKTVPVGDVDQIVLVIKNMFENRKKMTEISEKIKNRAEKYFSIESMTRNLDLCYEESLK